MDILLVLISISVGFALSSMVCDFDNIKVDELGLLACLLLVAIYSPLVYLWIETIKIIILWHLFVSIISGFLVAALVTIATSIEHDGYFTYEKINLSGLVFLALMASVIILNYLQTHAA